MDRYELMDERELLQRQEEERQRNELLEMMRAGIPGRRLPMIPSTRKRWTLMDELRNAYDGLTKEPPRRSVPGAIRG